MPTANYVTSTGYRFISKSKNCYKIHIHTPNDKVLHRSVGFVRIGEAEGLRKAVQLRNELGRDMWGKFWARVVNDETLITRLPHSIEPEKITVGCGFYINGKPLFSSTFYRASWVTDDGEKKIYEKEHQKTR